MTSLDDEPVLRGGFWDAQKILVVVVFIAGLLVGGFVTNKYIDKQVLAKQAVDSNSVSQLNSRLDQRNDLLYSCLLKNNISPETCAKG